MNILMPAWWKKIIFQKKLNFKCLIKKTHANNRRPSVAKSRIPVFSFLRYLLSNWMYWFVISSWTFFICAIGRISDNNFVMIHLIPVCQVFMTHAIGEKLIEVTFVIIILDCGSVTSGFIQRRLCLNSVSLLALCLNVKCLSKREIRIVDAGWNYKLFMNFLSKKRRLFSLTIRKNEWNGNDGRQRIDISHHNKNYYNCRHDNHCI